jgi:nucleotide-binding universal stress UspA family protein
MNTSNEKQSVGIILAGLDLGPLSEATLGAAAALAPRGSGWQLHVVHVMPPRVPRGLGESPANYAMDLTMDMERAQFRLNELGNRFADSVDRLVAHVRTGEPDVEIAQLASDLRAEMIVVGTDGKKGIERLLLGSVAESLVRHAPCAVFAFRPRVEAPWEKILPPCESCVAVQRQTNRAQLWCERHQEHHARPHTYREIQPPPYGLGAQTFRAI